MRAVAATPWRTLPSMRVLITGAEGQLGRSLQRVLGARDVVATGHAALDVSVDSSVRRAVDAARPDVIIHAAALTDTALCERDPDLAHAVNAVGAANVARASMKCGAMYIAISTDEVFGGDAQRPYRELDRPAAVNAYGASKLRGEQMALEAAGSVARIVRTSWLYGEHGNNFPAKILAAARAGRPLRFVTDEVSAPTATDDLAVAIRALIDRHAPAGIYHLVNEGQASRFDWAREVLRLAGMAGLNIEPVTVAQLRAGGYDGPRKPAYAVLANTRARALGITMRPWRDALVDYFRRAQVSAGG